MTKHASTGGYRVDQAAYTQRQTGWVGWVVFGAMMVLLLGVFHVFEGVVSLVREEVFVTGRNQMPVDVSYSDWGWVHLVVGVIIIVVGVCVLQGQLWARLVAAWLAFLSAVVNLAFLPAMPVWSAIMITIDVLVIWAFIVHGGELRPTLLEDEV